MKKSIILDNNIPELNELVETNFEGQTVNLYKEFQHKVSRRDYMDLIELIDNNPIENIFITDPTTYIHLFVDIGFLGSSVFKDIKNLFIIPKSLKDFNTLADFVPYDFFPNSFNADFKNKNIEGGIIKKNKATPHVEFYFNYTYNIKLNGKIPLFRHSKVKEEEFFLDLLANDKFVTTISSIPIKYYSDPRSKGIGFILSPIPVKNNEDYYKNILSKEINR